MRRERKLGDTKVGPSGDALRWDGGPQPGMRRRILILQLLATTFLCLMFYTNQLLNPDSFEVRGNLGILKVVPLSWGALGGIMVGGLICLLPRLLDRIVDNWENIFSFRYTRSRGIVTLIVILATITFFTGAERMYLLAVQMFIAFFYLAPLIFGMYGIWNMKGTHLITACMFSFFTAVSRPKLPSDLGVVMVFALSFLLFVEVGASSIRQYTLAAEELVPVRFQTKMVDRYLLYLLVFSIFALGLTYVALRSRYLLNLVSPIWAVEALEVQGLFGLLLPTISLILMVLFAKWVWERRYKELLRPLEDDEKGKRSALARFLLSDTGSEAS